MIYRVDKVQYWEFLLSSTFHPLITNERVPGAQEHHRLALSRSLLLLPSIVCKKIHNLLAECLSRDDSAIANSRVKSICCISVYPELRKRRKLEPGQPSIRRVGPGQNHPSLTKALSKLRKAKLHRIPIGFTRFDRVAIGKSLMKSARAVLMDLW